MIIVRAEMARILIIDDDAAVRSATKIALEVHGFDVVAVADGKSGISAVAEQQIDVVIVDLFMPGMDGLATTAAIRRINPLMPIITASGFMFGGACPEMPNFQAMAEEAGATAALYKPFRPKELLQAVQKAIELVA
jgi:CheY-like chemotaxis protein